MLLSALGSRALRSSVRHVACFLVVVACSAGGPNASSIQLDVARQRTIQSWLTCDECVGGELDRVKALGTDAIPELRRSVVGPPDSVLTNITRSTEAAFARARRQFDRLSGPEQAARPLGDSTTFIRTNVANFRGLYQVRAAIALKAISPTIAKDTLRHALDVDSTSAIKLFRPAVRVRLDSLAKYP